MNNPWKVILAFVGVFIAGAVFGGLFTLRASGIHLGKKQTVVEVAPPVAVQLPPKGEVPSVPAPTVVANPPTATRPPARQVQGQQITVVLMRQLTKGLNPTADQKRKIAVVVGRASDDLQRLQREHLQDTTRVTERMYEDVSTFLSPEQRIQLEKMKQEMLERVRKEREKRGELQGKGGGRQNTPGSATSAKNQQGP